MRKLSILGVAVVVAAVSAAVALAGDNDSGFKTSQPSMLMTGDRSDVTFTPIATVGEMLPGKMRFESIPDGIALRTRGNGRVDVYVNHETSLVPFPYNPTAPTEANSQNDFTNAEVSMLALNQHSAGVLTGCGVGAVGELIEAARDGAFTPRVSAKDFAAECAGAVAGAYLGVKLAPDDRVAKAKAEHGNDSWTGADKPSLIISLASRWANAGCSFLNSSRFSNTALVIV